MSISSRRRPYRWLSALLLLCALGALLGSPLPARAATTAKLTVTWEDAANDHDGFTLERKTEATGTYAPIATLGPTVLAYVDTAVTVGLTYCYQMTAFNEVGISPYSNEACAFVAAAVVNTLTVTTTGSGTVVSSPSGITCGPTCSASFPGGTSLALSATPATGAIFTGWGGVCTETGVCTVILDAAKTVTATFAAQPVSYALTVTKSGTGTGTVTSAPAGISCGATCSASYASGTPVTLTAIPATGATFTGWSGACTGTGSCLVAVDAAKSVTATFTLQTFALTVTKAGTGSGTVASTPAGIDCGTTCSASLNYGSSGTLTATPAMGSTFTGWSGACTGTGVCTLILDTAKSVTATFAAQPTVSGVVPGSGLISGGTVVTLTGTNFVTGATVSFGGSAATGVTMSSPTTITATTPAHAAGAVTVVVTNPDTQSGTLSSGFTYSTTTPVISFVQVAAATPQAPTKTVTVPYPRAQTAGNLNVVVVGWNDTTRTVQSVTDTKGNVYTLAIGPTSGTGLRQSIYYAKAIVSGSNTVTVTFRRPAVYPDIRIQEYSGVSTLDKTAGASGNSATANSGSATTTAATELIIGASTVYTSTRTPGTGFTARIITVPNGDLVEDRTVTAIGTYSATASLSSAGPWVMQMVTFK